MIQAVTAFLPSFTPGVPRETAAPDLASPPFAGNAAESRVTLSDAASQALGEAPGESRADRISKWTVIGGLSLFGAGCMTAFGAAASLAASPVLVVAGGVGMAAGFITALAGSCYGEASSASSDFETSLANPGNPNSPFHPGNPLNPGNPINLLMS